MSDEMKYDYGTNETEGEENTQQPENQIPYTQPYRDPYQNAPAEEPCGFAIASLVLGILSLVLSCAGINIITGILAIIFGGVHLTKYSTRKGMAIAGIVCAIVSFVLIVAAIAFSVAVFSSNADLYNQILDIY